MLRKYIKKIEKQLNQNFENICKRFGCALEKASSGKH